MYTKPINKQIVSRSTVRFRIRNLATGLTWPVLFSSEADAEGAIERLPTTFRMPGHIMKVEIDK